MGMYLRTPPGAWVRRRRQSKITMHDANAYRRWYRSHLTERTVPELLSEEQRESVMTGFGLSPREAEVLWQMFSNSSNEAIAAKLTLSENTIRTHRERLFAKLGVTSPTEAVAMVSAAVVATLLGQGPSSEEDGEPQAFEERH